MLVYSVTYKDSLNNLKSKWLKLIKQNCGEKVVIVIIANKIDDEGEK